MRLLRIRVFFLGFLALFGHLFAEVQVLDYEEGKSSRVKYSQGKWQDRDAKPLEEAEVEQVEQQGEQSQQSEFEVQVKESKSSFEFPFSSSIKESALALLKSNMAQMLSPQDWEKILYDRTKGTPLAPLFQKFPVLHSTLARILGTPESFEGLLEIPFQQGRWKSYGYWFFGLMITFFIVGLVFVKGTFLRRLLLRTTLTLSFFVAQVMCFYFHFSEQLSPSVAIIKQEVFG